VPDLRSLCAVSDALHMQIAKVRKSGASPSRSGNASPNRRVPVLAVGAAEKPNDEELFSPNRT
jgi:hypothetical protein